MECISTHARGAYGHGQFGRLLARRPTRGVGVGGWDGHPLGR